MRGGSCGEGRDKKGGNTREGVVDLDIHTSRALVSPEEPHQSATTRMGRSERTNCNEQPPYVCIHTYMYIAHPLHAHMYFLPFTHAG